MGDQSLINPKLCLKNLPFIGLKTHSVETIRNLNDSIKNHLKSSKKSIFPEAGPIEPIQSRFFHRTIRVLFKILAIWIRIRALSPQPCANRHFWEMIVRIVKTSLLFSSWISSRISLMIIIKHLTRSLYTIIPVANKSHNYKKLQKI